MHESILNFLCKENTDLKPIIKRTFENFQKGQVVTKVTEPSELEVIKRSNQVVDVTLEKWKRKPFVLDGSLLYWEKYYKQEEQIAKWIVRRIELDKENGAIDLSETIREKKDQYSDVDWQEIAALNSLHRSFSIITGGPGTGKTTTITKFLGKYLKTNTSALKIYAVAPTAKAARRMKESLTASAEKEKLDKNFIDRINEISPSTIHKLLRRMPGKANKFYHHSTQPISADLIIIDEASMIDISLMHSLLTAINNHDTKTKVIMLGDANQLKSVGAGTVFGDLCQTLKKITAETPVAAVVELLKSYRTEDAPDIFELGQQILCYKESDQEITWKSFNQNEVHFEQCKSPKEHPTTLKEKVIVNGFKRLHKASDDETALIEMNRVKVLCATNKGYLGVSGINEWIESELRCNTKKEKFYHNQPILITENNYNLKIYNGDTGVIRKRNKDEQDSPLDFCLFDTENKNEIKRIPVSQLTSYKTNYAMTIHKSQGSEYKNVVLVLPHSMESEILSKELIYTGVTRAKKSIVIYGKEEVFKAGIVREVSRASGMSNRLK
tara:strand:- start:1586 stop:3247 length:1662 start_codon:yes stop_codon:yes gene_type:complete